MKPSGRETRSRRPKTDLSLLDRRKVLDCLDAVRDTGPLNPMTADVLAQKLVRMGQIVPATLLRALETERDAAVVGLAARTLERMAEAGAVNKPRCISAIKQLVLSTDASDETKMRLLVTLSSLGVDVTDMRYAAAFRDFGAVAANSREEMLSEVASDNSLLLQLLEEIGRLPSETRGAMIEDYAGSDQPIVIELFRILGRSDDTRMAAAVIDCLVGKGSAEAATALKSLTTDAIAPETRERAARALKIMRFSGVRPAPARPRKLGAIHSALVSGLDGVGSRMIWVARKTPQPGRLFVIHLVLNDRQGIKDCFGGLCVPQAEYEEAARTLDGPGGMLYGSFDYDYCVELVRDALASNLGAPAPVAAQFLALMDIFGNRSLDPRPYMPSFCGMDLERMKSDRSLLDDSARLPEQPAFATWIMVSEPVRALAGRANRLTTPGRGHRAFLGDVHDQLTQMRRQIVRTELVPWAGVLRRRMELMADYLLRRRAGTESYHHDAAALVAAAQHLPAAGAAGEWPGDSLPPDENPFLLAMAGRMLEIAQSQLRAGCANLKGENR